MKPYWSLLTHIASCRAKALGNKSSDPVRPEIYSACFQARIWLHFRSLISEEMDAIVIHSQEAYWSSLIEWMLSTVGRSSGPKWAERHSFKCMCGSRKWEVGAYNHCKVSCLSIYFIYMWKPVRKKGDAQQVAEAFVSWHEWCLFNLLRIESYATTASWSVLVVQILCNIVRPVAKTLKFNAHVSQRASITYMTLIFVQNGTLNLPVPFLKVHLGGHNLPDRATWASF